MRFITRGDHFFQVFVLRLDDLISRVAVEWGIAWSTHLSACHRLHIRNLLLFGAH
jgi:hypothetical protein